MVTTNHGPALAYRIKNGGDAFDHSKRCAFVATCLCAERFEGFGPNWNKAADKAFRAREKHLKEVVKEL